MRNKIISLLATLGILGWAGSALAGDTAAGKAIYDEICSECHEPDDFEGESAADIKEWIGEILAGETKHKKKLELTDEQVDAIAAFYAAGGQ